MKDKAKIGILGGAFSPITKGHISIAEKLIEKKIVDNVWITPCYSHSYNKNMISAEHRINMVRQACRNSEYYANIQVCEYEIDKKIEGGTLVFINSFLNYFSNSRVTFYMIIGLDNANEINKWISYKTLIERIPFIVVNRKGIKRDLNIDWYAKKPHRYFENDDIIKSSSTEAREILNEERYNLKKINKLLDIDVYNYIIENNLYNKEVKKEKKEILGDIRWHTMADQSFREIPDHELLIKTEISIRICNSKNIDHNNIAKMYEEEVFAWAILNNPDYRENYGTEM
jgi:nicotinate-nucleotide adenylyltransferase